MRAKEGEGGRIRRKRKKEKKKTDSFSSACSDNGDVHADRMWSI